MAFGYVKVARDCLKKGGIMWEDLVLFKVWTWCKKRANFNDVLSAKFPQGRGFIKVNIGKNQLIFGRKTSSKEMQEFPSTVRNKLTKLQELGFISITPKARYSIIEIREVGQIRTDKTGQIKTELNLSNDGILNNATKEKLDSKGQIKQDRKKRPYKEYLRIAKDLPPYPPKGEPFASPKNPTTKDKPELTEMYKPYKPYWLTDHRTIYRRNKR